MHSGGDISVSHSQHAGVRTVTVIDLIAEHNAGTQMTHIEGILCLSEGLHCEITWHCLGQDNHTKVT